MTQDPSAQALAQADRRLPLHVRLKDDLVRRVRENEWPSNLPLPPESTLAEDYGVSMGTLRRVLTELTTEGILERHQGRGTFVRRATFQHSLFRFFRMHDGTGQAPDSRILERANQTASAGVAAALNIQENSPVLHLHRLRSWGDDPFLVEDIWLPLPQFQPIAEVNLSELGSLLYPEYENRIGLIIGSATEELSVTQATQEMANFLNCNRGDPIVKINRVARSHTGDVAEYRESHGLASSFQYKVEIN